MEPSTFTAFWQFFMFYRESLGYGLLAASINALVHYKKRDSARDSFVDVLFCGGIGWGVEGLLLQLGMNPQTAVAVCCMVGYVGCQIISDFLSNRFGLGTSKKEDKE